MNVIQVPFGFLPDVGGGTEIYVHSLARQLMALGIMSTIVAPGEQSARYQYDGMPVRRFMVDGCVSDLSELYGEGDAAAAASFGRILDEEQSELVHLHAFTYGVSLRLMREAKRRSLPIIFTYHTPAISCQRGTLMRWGSDVCDGRLEGSSCSACSLHSLGLSQHLSLAVSRLPSSLGSTLGSFGLSGGIWTALRMRNLVEQRHRIVRALLDEVDAIVVLCEWVRQLLLRLGVAPDKLHLSRHGLSYDPALSAPNGREPNTDVLRLAYFGRLDRTKGVDVLISAVRALPDVALQLDIYGMTQVGNDAYRTWLCGLAGEDPRIHFLPPVPNVQVRGLLGTYDVLAVPARGLETGPLVVLEAFAAGIPVLGSSLGGIAELVTDGVDGLLVAPGDVNAWSTALVRLTANGRLLTQLRAGVRAPRSLRAVGEETARLYNLLQSLRL